MNEREKKFLVKLGLLTGILFIAIFAVGFFVGGGKAKEQIEGFEEAKMKVKRMSSQAPYPSKANVKKRREQVIAFREEVNELKNSAERFKPSTVENIYPSEFQENLKQMLEGIKALWKESNVHYPEEFAMGFEEYMTQLPDKDATGVLAYELNALNWLFEKAAETKLEGIVNVVRSPLPIEKGEGWELIKRDKRGKPIRSRPNKDKIEPIYRELPVEITVKGREEVVRDFLNQLVASEEYFFKIGTMAIINERQDAPNRRMAGIKRERRNVAEPAIDNLSPKNPFATGADDEEEKVIQREPEKGQILYQILGNEKILAVMQLKLLLFTEQKDLPKVK